MRIQCLVLLSVVSMVLDGHFVRKLVQHQQEIGPNLYQHLFYCGSYVGVLSACNLTGQRSFPISSSSFPFLISKWFTNVLQVLCHFKLPYHQFITMDYSSCFFVTCVPCKVSHQLPWLELLSLLTFGSKAALSRVECGLYISGTVVILHFAIEIICFCQTWKNDGSCRGCSWSCCLENRFGISYRHFFSLIFS